MDTTLPQRVARDILMEKREKLPQRRNCKTFSFTIGSKITYQGCVGYYADGRPGEIFLDSAKSGTDVQVNMRDAAIAISMALQHGAAIEDIRSAFTRRADGTPEGPLGVLLDMITVDHERYKREKASK